MYRLLIVFVGIIYFQNVDAYVVFQNRRQNNNLSHAEALKKLSPTEIDKLSKSGRRQFDDDTNSLESVVLAIDTGVKQLMSGGARPDFIDSVAKTIVDFAKNSADPIYRSKGHEYDIKPEIIHFRSDKPSVMFELNSKSIINVLKDMLQSKTVHKYMDKFTKEAAVVYRAIKRELEKSQSQMQQNQ